MNTAAMTVVELTEDEVRLLKNALYSFRSAFGHDEAEMVKAVQRLLGKLEATQSGASRAPQ
jgi:hypothetical protein